MSVDNGLNKMAFLQFTKTDVDFSKRINHIESYIEDSKQIKNRNMSQTKQKVIRIIQDLGFGEGFYIEDNTSLVKELAMDSLDKVELVIECEKHFDVRVDDEDHDQITTVGEVVTYIEKKVELKN